MKLILIEAMVFLPLLWMCMVITDENVKCENCAYWKEQDAPHPSCIKTKKNDFCGEFKERRDHE